MKVNWTKELFERAEDVKRAIVPLSTGNTLLLTHCRKNERNREPLYR